MRIIYFLFAILFIAVLNSCVDETEIETDNYVINSMFSSETPFVIQTSTTVSVFDTATYRSIKDMEGKLFEDDQLLGELSFQEEKDQEGVPAIIPEGYTLPGFVPQAGKQYKLELKHHDQIITASDVMPAKVDFSITGTSEVVDDYSTDVNGIQCNISFKDVKEVNNYYIITYNVTEYLDPNDDIGWTQTTGWMRSDDPSIEYDYYHQSTLNTGYRFIFSDKYFNGKDYTLPVSFFVGHDSGRAMSLNVYLMNVSEQYYKYVTSSIQQNKNNDDYYAEPTQVYNNINNGYGVFAAYSLSKHSLDFGRE